jgi:hypothetical protein
MAKVIQLRAIFDNAASWIEMGDDDSHILPVSAESYGRVPSVPGPKPLPIGATPCIESMRLWQKVLN